MNTEHNRSGISDNANGISLESFLHPSNTISITPAITLLGSDLRVPLLYLLPVYTLDPIPHILPLGPNTVLISQPRKLEKIEHSKRSRVNARSSLEVGPLRGDGRRSGGSRGSRRGGRGSHVKGNDGRLGAGCEGLFKDGA